LPKLLMPTCEVLGLPSSKRAPQRGGEAFLPTSTMDLSMPAATLPIYYINLASRLDRREHMETALAQLGLVGERIDAVTRDRVPPELHTGVPPSYVASRLSHMSAWQRLVESRAPAAIVLEDDVVFAPAFVDFIDPAVTALGADLIKLETYRRRVLLGATARAVGAASQVRELQSSHFGAAAYLISADAARRALAEPSLRRLHTDRFLFGRGGPHLLRRKVLQADPAPCVQLMLVKGAGRSATASSDLAASGDRMTHTFGVHVDHSVRLLKLALRDPGAITRRRRAVRFAGD
jgi:glycosyl transferase family 25